LGMCKLGAAEVCSAEATELPVERDLRSLWQIDFATPVHWIPGQVVHADIRGKKAQIAAD